VSQIVVAGLLPVAWVAERMYLEDGSAGACGTTIFWKQVGQAICVPLALGVLLMCWPQTGQANLNSVMLTRWGLGCHARAILARSAPDRNPGFAIESDFLREAAQIRCIDAHEKELSSFP